MEDDYQFDDVDNMPTASGGKSSRPSDDDLMGLEGTNTYPAEKRQSSGGSGNYATEIFSKQIKAKFRTFYVDLKQSGNGKFVKISEKSHGRRSTIMMDAEDIATFIEALQEVNTHL